MSKNKNVTLTEEIVFGKSVVVVALVVLVTVSLAATTTASALTSSAPLAQQYKATAEYKAGYQRELSDYNLIVINGTNGELHCPLAQQSEFCVGYNDAMQIEANHQ